MGDSSVDMQRMDDEDSGKGGGCCNPLKGAQEDNMIVKRNRGPSTCFPFTDPLVEIAFFGFFIGLVVVFGIACNDGNLNRIYYGTDWAGNACGDDDFGTKDYKHQYWANPLYFQSMGSICLDSCPGEPATNSSNTHSLMANYAVDDDIICVCNPQLTRPRGDTQALAYLNDPTSPLATACALSPGTTSSVGFPGGTPSQVYKGKNWVRFSDDHLFADPVTDFNSATSLSGFMPTGAFLNSDLSGYPGYMPTDSSKLVVPQCMNVYQSYEIFHRCVPQISEQTYEAFCGTNSGNANPACPDSQTYKDNMNSFSQVGGQVMSDMGTCMYVIMASFGIAILMGFLYVWFMEQCAKCVVWTVILLSIMMSGFLFWACFQFGEYKRDAVNQEPQLATYETDKRNMYVAYVFSGIFGAIWFLITCLAVCFCRSINRAATLIQLASDAFLDFPYLIFYPAVQILGLFALVTCWSIGAALLASSGDQATDPVYGYHSWSFSNSLKYMGAYWLFGLLWISELMLASGFMIVGFCFAIWFFSEEVQIEGEKKKGGGICGICCGGGRADPVRAVPSFVLYKSMMMTYWNHFGTVCFGSLIMAIIDFIRIVVEYIDQKKKEMDKARGAGMESGIIDKVWDFIICCFRSCLWCLDCCMRFLNRNAYIQTIINGTSLCPSACRAVTVMMGQLPLFVIMTGIQTGVFMFGKFAISCSTAGICGLIITYSYQNQISSMVLPTFVCLMIGYGVATAFICVYDMGIDTMLMCYCEAAFGDAKREDGRPYHIPTELETAVEDGKKELEKQDADHASALESSAAKNTE